MGHILYKNFFLGLALLMGTLFLGSSLALAGGWAVVTLDSLPTEVIAGKPFEIGFMIRQHGHTPVTYGEVKVQAKHTESHEEITVLAQPEGATGHYAATLELPQAGIWQWHIAAPGLTSEWQPMPNLTVLDPVMRDHLAVNASSQAHTPLTPSNEVGRLISLPAQVGLLGSLGAVGLSLVWLRRRTPLALLGLTLATVIGASGWGLAAANSLDLSRGTMTKLPPSAAKVVSTPAASSGAGQALFIAKGCIVCHHHESLSQVRRGFSDFRIGPDLPGLLNDPQVLRTWLKDPQAINPQARMPDLELKKTEIEALVAFLTEVRFLSE